MVGGCRGSVGKVHLGCDGLGGVLMEFGVDGPFEVRYFSGVGIDFRFRVGV